MSFSAPTLTISLPAIIRNWQACRDAFGGQEVAAVVKANAYGLGAIRIARALADAGCDSFFVATLEEGIALRAEIPNRRIAVFHGVQRGEETEFLAHSLIPVLSTSDQLSRWEKLAAQHPNAAHSILHIDTGMHRLGLTTAKWDRLIETDSDSLKRAQVSLIMSHLACSANPGDEVNARQLERFQKIAAKTPNIPASLINSAAVFALPEHHFSLARPGCALYGISPFDSASYNPVEHVATLSAPILQIRTMAQEEGIGYSHTATAANDTRIATLALGYADGLSRALSNQISGYINGVQVPHIGRISMDMTCFDVSAIPEAELDEGAIIDILCEQQPVDMLAEKANTIGYEIFTGLGSRIKRVYKEA